MAMPTKASSRLHRHRHGHWLAGLSASLAAGPALAFGFVVNDDVRGAWNNLIAVGTAIRANNPDRQFVGAGNANQYPGAYGAVNSADDGNLNFRKGDLTTAPLTLLSDFELRYRNQYGVFARARAWYDMQLENHGVPHGHFANGFVPGAKLNDSDYFSTNKFSGVELLDAYVYGNFDIDDSRLTVRLGKQVINWGESVLYPGLNAFNPLNYAALGRPGARLDDALIPVNRIYANLIDKNGLSLEAFYALDWTRSSIPPCGTFGGLIDPIADPGCFGLALSGPVPDRVLYGLGAYLPQRAQSDPGSSGQYGVAARYFVEPLRTEFGAYLVRFNSPNMTINAIPNDPTSRVGLAYAIQYPQGVQGMGFTATTGVGHAALSAELSQFRNLPVPRNFATVLQGASGSGGPYAAAAATPVQQVYRSYFEANRTQLILGGRFDLSPTLGLADAQLTAETAMQWLTNLPGLDQERIGRNVNFGTAAYDGTCQGGLNVCSTQGFATRFSLGYRLLAQFSLPRPATGLDLQPVLLWSQDLKGYAADGSMIEGRYSAAFLLRAVYQQVFFVELGRTWLRHDTAFDPLRDKSVYLITAGARL
jgi:Protein of unknown function (DUF1302)